MKQQSLTTAADLIAKAKRVKEEASALQEYWTTILPPEFLPDIRQCQLWLNMYGGLDNCIAALESTAIWLQKIDQISAEREANGQPPLPSCQKTKVDVIKYASKCMSNIFQGIDTKPDKKQNKNRKRYAYQDRPGHWELGDE